MKAIPQSWRFARFGVLLLAAALPGCSEPEHAGLTPDVRQELEAGRAVLDSWLAASRVGLVPGDEAVIGLGYAERVRLGLGSPFRLMETALRDPRLSEPASRQIAWALLSLTLAGESYVIDPVALDRAGVTGVASWPGLGRHHLRLIEGTIHESRDPQAGELAVRLAYGIAALEGSLPSQAAMHATRAAAMLRDRELARADAARLLRSAESVQGDPLGAIAHWRSERWLRVEAPVLTSLPQPIEREAVELAPKLAATLRMLRPRLGDITATRPESPDVEPSFLTPAVARRLAVISDSTNMPPIAPIAVAARTYRTDLFRHAPVTDDERVLRGEFSSAATEEQFVALRAQLTHGSADDAAPSLASVAAAIALRPLAQERIWFPGFGGPTTRELRERFGFAAIRFSESVPAEWRPYYRGQLEAALRDIHRVLPALDLRGLSIRFASAHRGDATLAMHDPRTRELVLPPASAAGTIAHEVAHDLDWQVALRRYRVRGDYASDRAARSRTDRLALSVLELDVTAAVDRSDLDSNESRAASHARRPAENFARAVDWFVAASLAAQGRSNGFLSSVQDYVLTGYGTVRPPDITGRAGDALIDILDEVAPLYPATRERFLQAYGTARTLNSFDLIRSVMDVTLPAPTPAAMLGGADNEQVVRAFETITAARDRGFDAIDEWTCRSPGGARDAGLEAARRHLITVIASSRARGVALEYSRLIAGDDGARWVAHKLYGGPWPAVELDEGMEDLLGGLVEAARQVGRVEVASSGQTFELLKLPAHCRRNARFQ